jgi:hypothetical protein
MREPRDENAAAPVKCELFADMGESEARSVSEPESSRPSQGRGQMTFLFDYGDNRAAPTSRCDLDPGCRRRLMKFFRSSQTLLVVQ